MEGNWQGGAQGDNKYQYNDKEWNDDFGIGLNDYGARWYDPALGRWNSVDPLAEMYGTMSAYHYGMNNPIRYIDPTGMASEAYSFGMNSSQKNSDDRSTTIATTVVNEDTKETYTIDDGYEFNFNVSDKEFKEIKDKKGIGLTASYYWRWAREATAYKIAKAMQLGLKTGKKVVFDTAEGIDDEIFNNAGEDAMNGDFTKAAMMLVMSRIPGGRKFSGWIARKEFQILSPALQKKFIAALKKGIVGPKGETGVVIIDSTEELYKAGYRFKIKILGVGGDTRIYGKAMENGHVLFDFLTGH
jgi:RHS repeat-associated protein